MSAGDTWADIRATEHNLSFESGDVLGVLEAMGGRQSVTHEEDLAGNGNTLLDASEALAAKDLQSNSALMGLIESWKARHASYVEKSESSTTGVGKEKRTLTGEERLTYLNRAVELKLVLSDVGNLLADADAYKPTTTEKILGAKPAERTEAAPEPTISAQERKDQNTKNAAIFLKNAAKADQYFRENPVQKE